MLLEEFNKIILNIKNDVLNTRHRIQTNANFELLNLYFRIGKIISNNVKYGSNFVNDLSIYLKLEFPDMKGFSVRNLYRMKKFYEEYIDFSILPPIVAKLPWTHNCVLIEAIKSIDERTWYAKKCLENGWSKDTLIHQIDLKLYERQVLADKTTNFKNNITIKNQSELANDIIKDPYIFELEGIKEKIVEKDIERAMSEKIRKVLLEFGNSFSFVGNQYKISTDNVDYYIDLLFYHLELKCYIVVELKTKEFKPEYVGQLSFYVTAVDEKLRKDTDNQTIGLLLCKKKDKLSVDWALKSTSKPIGISSYVVHNNLPKELLDRLPTEDDLNKYINF